MAVPVIMPRQGQSVESCIIAKWHKKKGDRVEIGDILFSYETDKASFDEEAKVPGVLLDIFFDEGDDVPCLTNVCAIGSVGESTAEFSPNGASAGSVAAQPGSSAANAGAGGSVMSPPNQQEATQTQKANGQINSLVGTPVTASANADELKISPRAKKLAEKSGIDIRYATPTGPDGRIIERDIADLRESGMVFTPAAMAEQRNGGAANTVTGTGLGGRITTADLANSATAAPAAGASTAGAGAGAAASGRAAGVAGQEYEEVKLPNIRKVIARAMQQSLSTMAQLTLNSSFDISDILGFRNKLKESKDSLGLNNITINDIIIYAVSRTLAGHRDLNAHFLDDRMLYFKNVNIGVAVDTDRGLMVPVLFNANLLSLNEISVEVKKLVKDCQAGSINPDLMKNGTFTITNLGTLDIESFTPVINPPQTGILGVNNIVQRARDVNGKVEFYPAMGLSLTFDHRALDGAPAARFLKDLKTSLENFSALLAKA